MKKRKKETIWEIVLDIKTNKKNGGKNEKSFICFIDVGMCF